MKKVVFVIAVLLFSISFTSCKSSKGGCGLTSDVTPIQNTTTTEKV